MFPECDECGSRREAGERVVLLFAERTGQGAPPPPEKHPLLREEPAEILQYLRSQRKFRLANDNGGRRMDLAGLQRNVDSFVKESNLEVPTQTRLLDLVAEIGELSKEVLNATRYGNTRFEPTESWTDELGDVFFALICLSNNTGVDLEVGLERAVEKYRRRLRTTGTVGSEE